MVITKKRTPTAHFIDSQAIMSIEGISSNCWKLLKSNSTNILVYPPAGENSNNPQINLGKRFASPIKQKLPRAKRAKARNSRREASIINSAPNDVTPLPASIDTTPLQPSLTAATGEQFYIDYRVHKLPNESGDGLSDAQSTSALLYDISLLIETVSTAEAGASNTEVLVNKALLARIEVYEAENRALNKNQIILGRTNPA